MKKDETLHLFGWKKLPLWTTLASKPGYVTVCWRHPFDNAQFVFRYIKFDIFTPAAERGLPVTRVISRMALQQILARAVGFDATLNESHVDLIDDGNMVNGKSILLWPCRQKSVAGL